MLEFVKICQSLSENYRFSNFHKFLTNFSPPEWNPQKQSLGQILDKFGVRGVFLKAVREKRFGKLIVDPEVLQSGLGLLFSSWAWRILGELPANFSANSSPRSSHGFFSLQISDKFGVRDVFECCKGKDQKRPDVHKIVLSIKLR